MAGERFGEATLRRWRFGDRQQRESNLHHYVIILFATFTRKLCVFNSKLLKRSVIEE